jgi:hypothetical protein
VTDIRKRSVTELVESFAGRVQPPQAKALIELARRAMQVDKQDDVYVSTGCGKPSTMTERITTTRARSNP